MKYELLLTVAQSKRLIARGILHHPVVKSAYHNGTIVICRGTTCTYVAEEFLGHPVVPFSYTLGLTLPPHPSPPVETPETKMHDIIIRQGEVHMDGETVIEAAKNLQPGDVIIKGANALNYEKRIAGTLIGHPQGGTAGGFWGSLYGKKVRLVIPVGLEKEIAHDILSISEMSMEENPGNALMPMTGIIITEIEALQILTGTEVYHMASGGIRGAEGSIRLLVIGTPDQINEVKLLTDTLRDENPF
jgi:hypothetical protein